MAARTSAALRCARRPALAARAAALLGQQQLKARVDPTRGLDHGVFVPLKVVLPEADIPLVEMSVDRNFDTAQHLAAGRALAPLRDEGVLILGSGMSFHTMRTYGDPRSTAPSRAFDRWLADSAGLAAPERDERLIDRAKAPSGRFAHPQEEHLLRGSDCRRRRADHRYRRRRARTGGDVSPSVSGALSRSEAEGLGRPQQISRRANSTQPSRCATMPTLSHRLRCVHARPRPRRASGASWSSSSGRSPCQPERAGALLGVLRHPRPVSTVFGARSASARSAGLAAQDRSRTSPDTRRPDPEAPARRSPTVARRCHPPIFSRRACGFASIPLTQRTPVSVSLSARVVRTTRLRTR